jgi:hypothetical protein
MSAPVARFRPEHFIQAPNGVVTAIDYLPFGQLSGSSEHGNERGYLPASA